MPPEGSDRQPPLSMKPAKSTGFAFTVFEKSPGRLTGTTATGAVSSVGRINAGMSFKEMNVLRKLPPIATSVLLALAFPGAGAWPLAFIGLVPLLLWIQDKDYRTAFWGATLCGLLFYMIAFYWFATLTYWVGGIVLLGVALLFLFFALFWGATMAGSLFFFRRAPRAKILAIPAMWVMMEYVHNHIFTGFGWGSIGYTQWNNLAVAQLASVGSVYAVGFYVVLINVLAADIVRNVRRPKFASMSALTIVVLGIAVPGWGALRMRAPDMSSSMRVGIAQPNFSLDVKWSREYREHIFGVLEAQTDRIGENDVELIIWPESAFAGFLAEDIDRIAAIIEPHQAYLLTGSNHIRNPGERDSRGIIYHNSAFLLDPEGRSLGRYDKRQLAPFGEFVPFGKIFPFLETIVPAVADFTPGDTSKELFKIKGRNFGVLICFETSFPHLVRKTAALGADVLVELTNDGWFGRSSQPKQDLALGVFRAIENGATLIRCTNTGISCFIDPWGRISGVVSDPWGESVFARGISIQTISTVAHDAVYKSYGDIWVLACAVLLAAISGATIYRFRKDKDMIDRDKSEDHPKKHSLDKKK